MSKITQSQMTGGKLHAAAFDEFAQELNQGLAEGEANLPKFLVKQKTIFDEANEAIHGEKHEAYGPAEVCLNSISILWAAHIRAKYSLQVELDAEDVAWMMAQVKQSRAMHTYKRDNQLDAIGYIGLADEIARG